MTAKKQAIKDIKEYLRQENRVFISYRTELDSTMNELVEEYIKQQEKPISYCLSGWSTKK